MGQELDVESLLAELDRHTKYFDVELNARIDPQMGPSRVRERLQVVETARGSLTDLKRTVCREHLTAQTHCRAAQSRLELENSEEARRALRKAQNLRLDFEGVLKCIQVEDDRYSRTARYCRDVLDSMRLELRTQADWFRGNTTKVRPEDMAKRPPQR